MNACDGINHIVALGEFDTTDESGHGTAVTSVIAAARNNGIGIASMACGVTILPLRIFHGPRGNSVTQTSALAAAINYAIDSEDINVDII